MLSYMIRVTNWDEFDHNIIDFNVFAHFIEKIKAKQSEPILLSIDDEKVIPPIFWKKDLSYLRFRDINNPFLNGWIRGSKTQLARFVEEYKKGCSLNPNDILEVKNKIYINELNLIGEIEYISPYEPHLIVVRDHEKNRSVPFESLTKFTVLKEI